MTGALRILRKATTALLAATLIATGVTTVVMDRDGLSTAELIDVRHEGNCAQHHNHAICVVAASAVQILATAPTPTIGAAAVAETASAARQFDPARIDTPSHRSRAPPV